MEEILSFIVSPIGLQIIVLAFIVLHILSGYRRGFIQKILSLSSIVLSIISASIFTPSLSVTLKENTVLGDRITESLLNGFSRGLNLDNMQSGNTDYGILGKMTGLDKMLDPENIINSLRSYISENITSTIITIISAVLIFVLTLVLLKVVSHFFEYLNDIPFLGKINKILGGVLGFFIAIFIIWIVFAIFRVFDGLNILTEISNSIKSSPILYYIYENNLIFNFFSGIFLGKA